MNNTNPKEIEAAAVEEKEDHGAEKNSVVTGTFWMTFGSIFSRLIGALYVIPWNAWMAPNATYANSLFVIGYTPYQLFLAIGTAGFPSAMAKQIAQYNAKNQYKTGQAIYKRSLLFMVITGLISGALMYLLAPWIAERSPGINPVDTVRVIRALAPAVILVPVMSLVRGYFQGYQNMAPSAVSQVIEQIARVVYMLGATYFIMIVLKGNVASAVMHSTFAAFIGAAASMILLVWYYQRQLDATKEKLAGSEPVDLTETKSAIWIMIREAIPFIIIGSGITLGKMFDQVSFEPIMRQVTGFDPRAIADLYALFSFNADKLIMIIISLAVGMASASVPVLVEAYVQEKKNMLQAQTEQIIQLFAFIMFPAAIGMFIVARPIYNVFYVIEDHYTPIGHTALKVAALMSIILGLYTILTAILQSFSKHKTAIFYLAIGLLVKMLVQYPMIALFETSGPLVATAIGFSVTSLLAGHAIWQLTGFDLKAVLQQISKIALLTFFMALVSYSVMHLSMLFIPVDRKLTALIVVLLTAGAGGMAYIYLSLRTKIADELLGARAAGLRRKLRIK